jgi:hypothetical protein
MKQGFLHRPVVNEYLELILKWLKKLGLQQEPTQHRFQWVLTHDVDRISWEKNYWRSLSRDLLKFGKFRLFWKKIAHIPSNPYDTFSKLMDWSEQAGVKSRFYFMAAGEEGYDYEDYLNKKVFLKNLKQIQERGHIAGFHPGYSSFMDKNEWGKQYERLSHAMGSYPEEGRQHFLRFRVPETWRIWEEHGMKTDSSLGFAEMPGFRCGVCFPFPVFDVEQRKMLRLREMPLIAMDTTLAVYLKYSPNQSLKILQDLRNRIAHFGGNFVILWHNTNLYADFWPLYRPVYKKLISG